MFVTGVFSRNRSPMGPVVGSLAKMVLPLSIAMALISETKTPGSERQRLDISRTNVLATGVM